MAEALTQMKQMFFLKCLKWGEGGQKKMILSEELCKYSLKMEGSH